jgi:hypothetical protein
MESLVANNIFEMSPEEEGICYEIRGKWRVGKVLELSHHTTDKSCT